MQWLLIIAVFILAGLIYYPIARLARQDMVRRQARGERPGPAFWVLLIPLVGPLIYLLIRQKG